MSVFSSAVSIDDTGTADQYNRVRKDAIGISSEIAGASVTAYYGVYIDSAGKMQLALSGAIEAYDLWGIALSSEVLDAAIEIQVFGLVTNVGWSFSNIGKKVYLHTDGSITETVPDPPNIFPVGRIKSATSIYVKIPDNA